MHPEGSITDLLRQPAFMTRKQRFTEDYASCVVSDLECVADQRDGERQWNWGARSVLDDGTATYVTIPHLRNPRLEIGIRLWDEGVVHEEEG